MMDVDLLRPGTVPIPPDTFLWFEFLIDPNVLKKHLENPVSEPPPTELIVKFLTESESWPKPDKTGEPIVVDVECNGLTSSQIKLSKRNQALKILALKVASYLNWNLEILETKLPLRYQALLLKDLLAFVSEKYKDPASHEEIEDEILEPQVLFSITLYHRWVIRYVSTCVLNGKQNTKLNGLQAPLPATSEQCIMEANEAMSEKSVKILQKLVSKKNFKVVIPSFESFVPLTDEIMDVDHRWDLCRDVSPAEFRCQVLVDVSNYLLFRESYSGAKETLKECLSEFQKWKNGKPVDKDYEYCSVTHDYLMGCCIAVGIKPRNFSPSLPQQFHRSFAHQYTGITRILEKDNVTREIPMMYRDSLELDIISECASGKTTAHRDGIMEIQAINVVRRALEGTAWDKSRISPTALNKAVLNVLPTTSPTEKEKLRYFLLELLSVHESAFNREMCSQPCVKQLLSETDILNIQGNDFTDPVPQVLISGELDSSLPLKNSSNEISFIERLIVTSYEPGEIKSAIKNLLSISSVSDMGKINRAWDIPISVYNPLKSVLRGSLLHYVHVLVAKSYELDKIKNFRLARTMLRIACEEVSREPGFVNSLVQTLSWEILLVDIHQFHYEWPAKTIDWSGLSRECTTVLGITDVVRPRSELYEQCILALLNMGQWQSVVVPPSQGNRGNGACELYASIGSACMDIYKYNKKVSSDAWDKFLPVFLTNQKRRDSFSLTTTAFCSIVEMNALAVVISLLAKLHNVLNNQPSLDLYILYTALLPINVKNASQYNVKYVAEMLYEVLNHALKLYPHNVPWLKLYGDLSYANGHYSTALKYYLEAAISGTDYFWRPLTKNVLEDAVLKRMIKCCTQLQCHTQAAVLCQFLDDIDYTTAYKSLAEGSCADAMDTYYDCFWDVTILEYLINLHHKRGEHYRKQKAVRLIGLLELNANNNEEIRREAENIRKGKFLRAMAKQYC